MKLMNKILLLITLLTVVISCNKDFPDPKKKVVINKIAESTELPGEVSIFFQVYDRKNETPIAGLHSGDFTIYEQGPNDSKFNKISESEASSSIVLDDHNFIFSTMLVLDLSGSVTSNNLEELKTSSLAFINEFMPTDVSSTTEMGVWWFDGEENLHELHNYTAHKDSLLLAINSITSTISSDNSTNLYGAVTQASAISLSNTNYYDSLGILNSSAIVIFTDGTDQAAFTDKNQTLDLVSSFPDHTKFLTIGLGDEIDEKILKEIGSDGHAFAEDPSTLTENFSKIALRISDEANSYYLFKYCSPKRNGTDIKLKLEINTKLNGQKHKGALETSFDATGFTGC